MATPTDTQPKFYSSLKGFKHTPFGSYSEPYTVTGTARCVTPHGAELETKGIQFAAGELSWLTNWLDDKEGWREVLTNIWLQPTIKNMNLVVSTIMKKIEPTVKAHPALGWLVREGYSLEESMDRLHNSWLILPVVLQVGNVWGEPSLENFIHFSPTELSNPTETAIAFLENEIEKMPYTYFLMWDYKVNYTDPTWLNKWLSELEKRINLTPRDSKWLLSIIYGDNYEKAVNEEWPDLVLLEESERRQEVWHKLLLSSGHEIHKRLSHRRFCGSENSFQIRDVLKALKHLKLQSTNTLLEDKSYKSKVSVARGPDRVMLSTPWLKQLLETLHKKGVDGGEDPIHEKDTPATPAPNDPAPTPTTPKAVPEPLEAAGYTITPIPGTSFSAVVLPDF